MTAPGGADDPAALRRQLLAFLHTIARPGADLATLGDDVNLFDAGVLDSLAVIQIIQHLEQGHGVRWSGRGLDPAELATLGGIMRLCASRGA